MEQLYQTETVITPSLCDADGRLGLDRAFRLFMDISAAHSQLLGCGVWSLLERDRFWLAVRSRAVFSRRPRLGETVTLSTWPDRPGKVRVLRSCRIEQQGQVLAAAKTDWAVLRISDHSLSPVAELFPPELDFSLPPACPERFPQLSRDFGPEDVRGEYRVRATDIDLGGHMNNTAYLPLLLDSFTTAQLRELDFREVDLSFRAPCLEGDLLQLACRRQGAAWDFALLRQGQPAFLARLA